jgi:excisionase family DNA binding protein
LQEAAKTGNLCNVHVRDDAPGSTPAARWPGRQTAHVAQDWYSVDDLAAWLNVSKRTVYGWNRSGGGPAPTKVGRRVRYSRAAVDEWLRANTHR